MTQHERNQLARAARESGLCMKCGGEIEDKLNDKGIPFALCKGCRPSKKARVNERDVQNPRPRQVYDVDYDYRDTKEFKAYALRVRTIVARSIDGVTTADIHRELGTEHRHWTMDVLNGMENLETRLVLPTRYRIFTDRNVNDRPITRSPHIQILPSRTLVQPDNASIYREARI